MSVPDDVFPRRASPEELLAHGRSLRRLARALVGEAAADDLVQDAWVAALVHPPDGERPTAPWLARVARNLALNRRRGDERRVRREREVHVSAHAPAADEAALAIEAQRTLLDAVEALAEPLRSTVARHYLEGRTSAEIARTDGVAESTVRGRLVQAIEELRRRLDARHGDRSAWTVLVLPLARRGEEATAATSAGAATVGGLWIMSTWTKLAGALAVAALVSVAAWQLARDGGAASEEQHAASQPLASAGAVDEGAASDSSALAADLATVRDAAASAQATPNAPAVLQPARVRVRFLDPRGAPIAGASLACIGRVETGEIAPEDAPRATSGPDGQVELLLRIEDASQKQGRLGDWPDSRWSVRLEASGRAFASASLEAVMDAGKLVDLGDVVLADGGDVAGVVVDEHGRGIEGARVALVLPDLTLEERDEGELHGLADKKELGSATTDALGRFAVHGVRSGILRAWTRKTGRACAISEPFEVRAGATARVPDLVARASLRVIRGRVVGPDGAPCAAWIEYSLAGESATRGSSAALDSGEPAGLVADSTDTTSEESWSGIDAGADGTFVVDPLDAEAVDLHALRTLRPSGAVEAALVRGVLAGTHDVVLRLEPVPGIELVVQDEGGAPVATFGYDCMQDSGDGEGRANLRGGRTTVRSYGLPFRLTVKAPGFFERDMGRFEPSALPRELVVTLERAALIAGRVVSGGAPVADADVRLRRVLPPGSTKRCNGFALRLDHADGVDVSTNGDGTFALSAASDGRWVLVARKRGLADAESEELDVGPRRGREGIVLELPRGGSVSGRVRGLAATKAPMRWVTFSHGSGFDVSTAIEADGSYAIEALAPGTWHARATETDHTGSSFHDDGPPEPGARAIVVADGRRSVLDLDVPSPDERVELAGRFALAGGDPRAWTATLVRASDRASRVATQALDATGAFRLDADGEGAYVVRVASAGTSDRADVVEAEVTLARGTNAWSFAARTGSIASGGAPADELELAWSSTEGARWTATVRAARGAKLLLPDVPEGRVTIRAGTRVVAEVDVVAGTTTTVAWR